MPSSWIKDWWPLILSIICAIATGAVMWTRMTDKTNGLGRRVKIVEDGLSQEKGRTDRLERELAEYRRDASLASQATSRVERGVDDVREQVGQIAIQLGSQLHNIEKLIQEKDLRTQTRLVRIETIAKIEEKIGSLPIE